MPRVTTVTPNGPVIRDLRERRGLSRRQLGKKTDHAQQTIWRLEAGFPANRLIVCQVANVLKVDAEELIMPETASDEDEAAA